MTSPSIVTPPVPDHATNDPPPSAVKPPPWWVLWTLLLISSALLVGYGVVVGSTPLLLIELLLGIAAAVSGGFVGFLFGIPRANSPSPNPDPGDTSRRDISWNPSTNLEQVADWLTKIIVGVGLVEIDTLRKALAELGGIVALAHPAPGVAVVSQLVVVAFMAVGFMASYLWTRIDYQRLQATTDNDLRTELSKVRAETSNLRAVTKQLASGELKVQSASPTFELTAGEERNTGWSKELSEKVSELEKNDYPYDSDPVADLFPTAPRAANGRKLEATIVANLKQALTIKFTLRATGPTPLEEPVAFLLHPTFQNRVEWVKPKDGIASLSVYSEGTFTVVAIADGGKTILAYPLDELPGAPKWFLGN